MGPTAVAIFRCQNCAAHNNGRTSAHLSVNPHVYFQWPTRKYGGVICCGWPLETSSLFGELQFEEALASLAELKTCDKDPGVVHLLCD